MSEQGFPLRRCLKPVTVMVVDDHPALRAGLCSLIGSDHELRVLLQVASGEEAYAAYRDRRPDVVVMDLSMKGFGGIEAIRRIRALDPQASILVYSVHNSPVLLERSLEAGAIGFVTKGSNVDTLLEGLKKAARGESFVSSDMLPSMVNGRRSSVTPSFKRLTQREFQVFKLLSEGSSLADCASTLNLSAKTVSNHFTRVKAKLGVSSSAEMARMAIRQGLIEP